MRLSTTSLVTAACILCAGLTLACRSMPASAEPTPTPAATVPGAPVRPFPQVSVTGTTELAIAPDEAWLHLRVESFFPTMERSVEDNDTRIAAVLKALRSSGVGDADLATETMTLAETDRYEGDNRRVHGWAISRSVTARVSDLSKVERILQQVIKAGATNVDAVRFAHSKITEKKVEARAAAVKAAREKAELMAATLGQKIGRAVAIRESTTGAVPFATNVYANEVVNAGGQALAGNTIAAGRIRIEVSVEVEFELL